MLWDSLDPHIPNGLLNGKEWSWKITLPNVECERCTLQIMQIMQDAQIETPLGPIVTHGPFDGDNDLYYRCVDIVLKRGAGESVGTTTGPATNNGIHCVEAVRTDGGVEPPDEVVVIVGDAGAPSEPHEHPDGDQDAGASPSDGGGAGAENPSAPGDKPSVSGDPSTSSGGCSVPGAGGHGAGWAALFGALALLGRAASVRGRS